MFRNKRFSSESLSELTRAVEDAANVAAFSVDDLCTYFMHCVARLEDVPGHLHHELIERWADLVTTTSGRAFLRRVTLKFFVHGGGLDDLVGNLPDNAQEKTHLLAPDLYYVINRAFFQSIDLVLLIRIEQLAQKFVCRKTTSPEFIMPSAAEDALHIDFYKRAGAIHMQWSSAVTQTRFIEEWAIPPQARWVAGLWYVPKQRFEERLGWLCSFLPTLLRHDVLRNIGAVLSGSILPLCMLKHEVHMETRLDFLAYAAEIYKKCSVDIFVTAPYEVRFEWLAREFIPVLQELSQTTTWAIKEHQWSEDDEWVRDRRGITHYISTPLSSVVIQIISMPSQTRDAAIAHQHLPCVRACYDGENVYVTAGCIESWMSRFISSPPLFGSKVSQQRRSKIAFKYAMRGWGFSRKATSDMQFPDTLTAWLRDWPEKNPLPWYHPLYNPNMWPKAMSPDCVKQLLECADI